MAALSRRANVRLREVFTLEEQRLIEILGESVGKAVAKVQAGLVPAFAEIEKGLSGEIALFDCHGLNGDRRAAEEGFDLPHPLGPELLLNHHG